MTLKQKNTPKAATMYDVARLAGVSQPTVSRILNGDNVSILFSEVTIQKVYDAVLQLNYRPNIPARSLRTGKTALVAILTPEISTSFQSKMIDAILRIIQKHSYDAMLTCSWRLIEFEEHFCEVVTDRSVDGIILTYSDFKSDKIDRLINADSIPIIMAGHSTSYACTNVNIDYLDDEQALESWIHCMRLQSK